MKANHGGHSTNGTSKGELEHLPLWLHPAFKKRTLSFTSLRRNLNCAVKYSIARRIVERHAMSAPEAYPSLCFGCRHYRPMIPRTDCSTAAQCVAIFTQIPAFEKKCICSLHQGAKSSTEGGGESDQQKWVELE